MLVFSCPHLPSVVNLNEQQCEAQIDESVAIAEVLIGSRPPRCEGRCAPCGRCEAVQVPVAPRMGRAEAVSGGAGRLFRVAGDGVDESSTNYKPLNWRCRCADPRALDP
ncbi:hypothetical protein PR202_ga13300 [Eleusine coracana subsp. coracana]|uniref:Epidermal patterning factor-like protein n=1 Tax=Eleusine coracana subsp. coracana TaxID=191504 RepID=A0AAV5CDP9_ELECO|nr:hypothetical protein PR202_ga13300 [Eleusine coracana subsp. coracana]